MMFIDAVLELSQQFVRGDNIVAAASDRGNMVLYILNYTVWHYSVSHYS